VCGFIGELRFDATPASVAKIERMAEVLAPRGPDGGGVFAQGPVALGHRRLKIIDLTERAQQPMVDADLGLSIVYNGAIYNHKELRAELEARGFRFFSDGDTEVVLKAYQAWGEACVERLFGMFAFAIVERDSGRVFLGRDRQGIKPLYWADVPGGFRFGSTLPAIVAGGGVDTSIDPVALHHYMSFHSVVPPPHTILRGVRKLPPATTLTIEPDGTRRERTYWSLSFAPDPKPSFEDWQDEVLCVLRTAVKRRLVADVPVGVLLSGGLDSSLVVGLLREAGQDHLATFSIGFESVGGEEGDEFKYSDVVVARFETDHHKIFVDPKRTLDNLDACIHAQSEPMVSHDNIGFYLLSHEVAKSIKVVQSGQGADEVFAGYHWYPPMLESTDPVADYARVFFDRDHADIGRVLSPDLVSEDHSQNFVRAHFDAEGARRGIDKALRIDTTVMLVDDPVKRVDNMTMAWGLEARVPFLDHEVVELAARIPGEHKVAGGGKHVLKEAARRVIPHEVIDRPKGYFPVPALKYLSGPFLQKVEDALASSAARQRGLFQADYVSALLRKPDNPEAITPLGGSKLWQIALLELWLQSHGL
jgi:asparagine synthase (glutamine-hydrolysing)